MSLFALLVVWVAAQEPNPVAAVQETAFDPVEVDDAIALPPDADLQRIAATDAGSARPVLRRAARSAPSTVTRALALRLLATHDASSSTGRICARLLRLDPESVVRRAAAECLGQIGSRHAAPQTPALVAALDDVAIDVVTMAGWALANVGDAGAIAALTPFLEHPDARVVNLFRGYFRRLRDRFGLAPPPTLAVATAPTDAATRVPTAATRAAPPGVALTLSLKETGTGLAIAWLGTYGAAVGMVQGPLLASAHGGPVGAEAGALVGLAAAAGGSAALAAYGAAADLTIPEAHTVVQLGTLAAIAGFGAGQLVGFPPVSAVASTNLSLVGTAAGIGLGVALVSHNAPTMGALAAGSAATAACGVAGSVLASSYSYPVNQSLGVGLLSAGIGGLATTMLLARVDLGLFPVVGAFVGGSALGGVAALGAIALDPGVLSGRPLTAATGWLVLSAMAGGSALGAAAGAWAPRGLDPFVANTLRLSPPTVGVLPRVGGPTSEAPFASIAGSF
jgi:hypothetical protein